MTSREFSAAVAVNAVEPSPSGGVELGQIPVYRISWVNAKRYTDWLTQLTGHTYRLLSESEWEYCCKAGATGLYHTGDSIDTMQAHFNRRRLTEVGSYPPNRWGLHDMIALVNEWCEDAYLDSYDDAPSDGSPFVDPHSGKRVVRGNFCSTSMPNGASRRGVQSTNLDLYGLRVRREL